MHHVMEIIMPQTNDVERAVAQIMEPFDENDGDRVGFWDFYVIGGRWAGDKLEWTLGQDRISEFRKMLADAKITVSGFQAGKPELSPASQIRTVDAMWRDFFPDSGIDVCPLFNHSNDQYKSSSVLPGDICRVDELPVGLSRERVIIAAPRFSEDGLEAVSMYQKSFWNGCDHVTTTWDGLVMSAIDDHQEKTKGYQDGYREKVTPRPDWISVTVDYHS